MARNRYYQSKHWKRLKQATHERDHWRCVLCGSTEAIVCDHIATRPNVDEPTSLDVLTNTRTLCGLHDRQLKERPDGSRGKGGELVFTGIDGWPTPRGGYG